MPALLVFLFQAFHYGDWLIDDAGISFAYAKNIATGIGPTPQAGLPYVEGFSNPTWTALFAVLYRWHLFTLPLTAKLVSAFCIASGFVAVAAAARRLSAEGRWLIPTCSALILTAANPSFTIWSVSGLENPLLVLLGGLLFFFCADFHSCATRRHALSAAGAGVVASALALTRPDGLVYAAAFPIWTLSIVRTRVTRETARALGTYFVVLLTPLVLYLAFRHIVFGDWLPNTYYAKPGTSLAPLVDVLMMQDHGGAKIAEFARATLPAIPLLGALTLAFNIAASLRAEREPHVAPLRLLTLMASLGLFCYLVLPPDWMGELRFCTLPILFFYCLFTATMQWGISCLPFRRFHDTAFILLMAATLLYCSHDFRYRAERFAEQPTAPLQTVYRNFHPIESFAKEAGMTGASLLIPDLGATLMFSKLKVIDLAGLCDKEIGRLMHERASPDRLAEYLAGERRPDFVHIQGWWAMRSGLVQNSQFMHTYLHLGDGNYVRRASLPDNLTDEAALKTYRKVADSPVKEEVSSLPF